MKTNSVSSLVHNDLHHSIVVPTVGLRSIKLNPMVFWKFFTTFTTDLHTNKVNLPNEKRFSHFTRS